MAEGVDVSNHQSGINWGAARGGGIEFAYAKLTEGIGYNDPRAADHINGARGGGLLPGGYHYARPDTNAPEADAEDFAAALMRLGLAQPGVMPPCLDMEQDARVNMVSWVQRCMARVRAITGYGPMIVYANSSWWFNQLGGGGWLDDQAWSWVAHYDRPPGQPGFKGARTVMHQYTSSGRIDGYGANIDRNVCWVDLSTLTQGGQPGPAPTPDPRPDGWYTVRAGQTLSEIGQEVGIPWRTLAEWNALPDPNLIQPGQRLRLTPPAPGGGGGTYTVLPGDTLSGIGAKLGVDWHAIHDANRGLIKDPNKIQPGWVLHIPGGGGGTPAPPPPAPARTYTVVSGDTLSGIGTKLGIPWRSIYDANRDKISNPNHIEPGWVLRLP